MNMTEKQIVSMLGGSMTETEIEVAFESAGVSDCSEKTKYLNACMGNPRTYFSVDGLSAEDEYKMTKSMFATGAWRVARAISRAARSVKEELESV